MTILRAGTMVPMGLVVLAVAWAAFSQDASRPAPATRPAPRLRLELTPGAPRVAPGEWLKFSAVLFNEGREPVTVVLPGDGSTEGWRTPVVRWNPATPSGGRRCGNVNVLKAEEVVTLEPGKSVKIDEWLGQPVLAQAGSHAVFIEIENVPDLEWRGVPLGEHDAGAMERVRKSQPFKIKSNVVIVEVQEHHPELAGTTVPEKDLEEQRRLDVQTIEQLKSAGSDLSKPHLIEHHFICRDHAIADKVAKWGADQRFGVSKLTLGKWKGQEAVSFDLVQQLVPAIENVTPETTTMLKIARKSGAHYDGWGAAAVK